MSPEPLDPVRAMKGAINSLEEQVKTRVGSVENGRKFQPSGKGDAGMPDGAAIFATTGAWEDFATPARDFRLLIAIDVVRGYPDHVVRRPDRYVMPFGKSAAGVKADLESVLASELAARKFSYTRSDGSAWTLTLKDVVDRAAALEMAYNLNDCVELRWGAAEGSAEAATCKRRAPPAQHAKMAGYRAWFRDRHWPPRRRSFLSSPAARGRGTARRAVVGVRPLRGGSVAYIFKRFPVCLFLQRQRSSASEAPSTTLRVVPLPRCAGADGMRNRTLLRRL